MDLLYLFVCVFFFKQKTAYEMRISDWSSDVCSSDLRGLPDRRCVPKYSFASIHWLHRRRNIVCRRYQPFPPVRRGNRRRKEPASVPQRRSEEHTSELQSLMRISYAVFCLKKKNKSIQKNARTTTTTQHKTNKQLL